MSTAVRDRELQPQPDIDRGEELPRPSAPTSVAAAFAGSAMVVVCLLARFPDRLLAATGIRGWAAALIAVLAMVNAARLIGQAPFTFARRRSSAAQWAGQQVAALAGMILVGAALTVPLYALIRASSLWWLWAWMLFAVLTIAGQVAMPLIVRVQVGRSQPAPEPLAQRVRAVGARAGVDVGGGVFVADGRGAHRPSKGNAGGPRCNAYLIGLGPTRRIVLESELTAWSPDLVDQVAAHEFGHWRLGHAWRRLPVALAAQLATFALASWCLSFPPLLRLAGVARAGDPRSYPLLLALTAVVVLPARLALAALDRAHERAADRFALATLGTPEVFAAMLERAAADGGAARTLPWWRLALASHPPIDERVLACHAPAGSVPARSIKRGVRS